MSRSNRRPIAAVIAIAALAIATGTAAGTPPSDAPEAAGGHHAVRESLLYVVAIDSGDEVDPDFLAVVGADPRNPAEYGRIISRTDLPDVGDNVHHFGYSLDQDRLIVPGMFSDRIHVFDVSAPKRPRLLESREDLTGTSGYRAPHTVSPLRDGEVLVSMLGADTDSTGPGGVVVLDDRTGEFLRHFGPGPTDEEDPEYMYDLTFKPELDRAVSTTWGHPGDVFEFPFGPNGDEVAIWDVSEERVLQTVDLGSSSGATEADWLHAPDSKRGFTIASNGLWMWEDDDDDDHFDFHLVVTGLAVPCDMVITPDDRHLFVANWLSDTIQLYDITEPRTPRLVDEATVPHPCMMRLSPEGERLYATNSVMGTLDDEPLFGPRNDRYGIWQFVVDQDASEFHSVTEDGGSWVDFSRIHTPDGAGPAGPHMIVFDPGVPIDPGHH